MLKTFNRYDKVFMALGITAIMIAVGFFSYKTYLNYKAEITERRDGLPEISPLQFVSPTIPYQGGSGIMEKPLTEKSILMIIAFRDFRDEEYFIPKQNFLAAGVKTILTASTQMGTAIGADGGEASINLLVKNANVADFDAVVFVGGPGALKYLDNEDSYRIVRDAVLQEKLLSAICVAPAILAKAGVLEGKKATVWSSALDKSAVKILQDNGAIFENEAVVREGKIITANGPEASDDFSMEIIDFLMQ